MIARVGAELERFGKIDRVLLFLGRGRNGDGALLVGARGERVVLKTGPTAHSALDSLSDTSSKPFSGPVKQAYEQSH
jgi:hypothetical protein